MHSTSNQASSLLSAGPHIRIYIYTHTHMYISSMLAALGQKQQRSMSLDASIEFFFSRSHFLRFIRTTECQPFLLLFFSSCECVCDFYWRRIKYNTNKRISQQYPIGKLGRMSTSSNAFEPLRRIVAAQQRRTMPIVDFMESRLQLFGA